MLETIENNTPQTLEQFTMVQKQLYVENLVNDLTSNRRLRGKRPKKTEQVVLGYNVIMNLIAKFKP